MENNNENARSEYSEKIWNSDAKDEDFPASLIMQVKRLDRHSGIIGTYGQISWFLLCVQIGIVTAELANLPILEQSYFFTILSASVLAISVVFLVRRDFLVARGNDIFQVISDALEDGSLRKMFASTQDNTDMEAETNKESIELRKYPKAFSLGDIRLIMRQFVTSSKLPLLRESRSPELAILIFHVVCFVAVAFSQRLLSDF